MRRSDHRIVFLPLTVLLLLSCNGYAAETKADLLLKTRGLAQAGQYKEAIVELNKIIAIDPDDPLIYMMRAYSYNKVDLLDQAIADYSKVTEIDRMNANAYYNRGYSYFLKKDYAQSWADLHRAESLGAKLDPKLLEDLRKASGRNK